MLLVAVALVAPPSSAHGRCEPRRPAIWHHASGRAAGKPRRDRQLIPCASPTRRDGQEPTIGVSRGGQLFVDAMVNMGDLVRQRALVLRSVDHGLHWHDISPVVAGQDRPTNDPYLWLDERTGRVFSADLGPSATGSYLSFSDNQGATWTTTIAGTDLTDHETVFGGRPSTLQPQGYPDVVYYCANFEGALALATFGVACDRSLDGGLTWSPSGAPAFTHAAVGDPVGEFGVPGACNTAAGHGSVGPDGTVYVPAGWCGQPWLAISHDEGQTWTRVQVARSGMPYTSFGLREHEAGVGADRQGRIYYTWVAHDRLPYLAVSRDGGRTWARPMMIAAPGVREATLPGIDVTPSGAVAIDYMASTNSPGPPYEQPEACLDVARCGEEGERFFDGSVPARYSRATWNAYLTVAARPIARNPTFASQSLNNPKDPLVRGDCGPIRCREEFDFLDVEFGPDGSVWAPYIDGCVRQCISAIASGGKSPDNAHEGWVGRLKPVGRRKSRHETHRHKPRHPCRSADNDRGCDGATAR